jgi:hypothetical protein
MKRTKWIPAFCLEEGRVYSINRHKNLFKVLKRLDDDQGYRVKWLRPGPLWSPRGRLSLELLRGYRIDLVRYYDSPLWKVIHGNDD